MLKSLINDFIQQIQDPEISSSLIPLILVITLFFVGTAILVYKLIRFSRTQKNSSTGEADLFPQEEMPILLLTPEQKIRHFFKRLFMKRTQAPPLFIQAEPQPLVSAEELKSLREEIQRLKEDNVSIRDQHAKAVKRISELLEQAKLLGQQHESAVTEATLADSERAKLQTRIDQLEGQLKEIVLEVESLYRQNAKAVAGKMTTQTGKFSEESPDDEADVIPFRPAAPPVHLRLQEQAEEIKRLKSLLLICREQILQFTQKNKTSPPAGKSTSP